MTTRNAVKTTVPRGRSGGRAKQAAEAAKVKANAEKVAAINSRNAEDTDQWGAAAREDAALKAWQKGGSKGERPATPTLDAINGTFTAGKAKGKGAPKKRRVQGPLAAETQRVRVAAQNHRGKGKALTDAEVITLIKKLHAKHPDAGWREVREYVYWVEGVAMGAARWDYLWAHVIDGKPLPEAPAKKAPAKAPAKAAAPKKAPAKKAPAKATVSDIGKTAAAAKRVEQRRARKAS